MIDLAPIYLHAIASMLADAETIALRLCDESEAGRIRRTARRMVARGIILSRGELAASASWYPAGREEDPIGSRESYDVRMEHDRGWYSTGHAHARCLWHLASEIRRGPLYRREVERSYVSEADDDIAF